MLDAIYVISLERFADRRKKIVSLLEQIKFCPVFIFDAVDGKNINTIDMNTEGFYCYDGWKIDSENDWWNRPVKLGEACCMISHFLVWKDIERKGFKNVLIIEDDSIFVYDELIKGLNIVNTFNKEYDIFYLGCNPVRSGIKVNASIEKSDYTYCTHGYIITKECSEILVNSGCEKNMIPADEFLSVTFCDHPREDLRNLYNFKRKLTAYRLIKDVINQTNLGGSATENSKFVTQEK